MIEKEYLPNVTDGAKEKKENKKIIFPHAESVLRLFREKYENESEEAALIEDILYEFLEQEMENINIFKSEKFETSFPYTALSTNKLLKKIIEKNLDEEKRMEALNKLSNEIKRQEYIFSSGSITKSGYPFTFVEEAMHQALLSVKSALIALQEGREIKDREIYTIGLPTNELGNIGKEFLEKLEKDPFGTMGELQSEFIQSHLPRNQENIEDINIRLYGISTGASLAAATGEKLIADGVASQSTEKDSRKTPRLSIRMDSPVGLSNRTTKKWQIPVGYVAEFMYQTFKDPKFRLADPRFMSQVKEELSKRGIAENMEEEEKKAKNKAIKIIITKLKEGVDFSDELKVTKVTGLMDPLTFHPTEYSTEKDRQGRKKDKLGKNISPRFKNNRREFMIGQTHTPSFFRDSELNRYHKVATLIKRIKES